MCFISLLLVGIHSEITINTMVTYVINMNSEDVRDDKRLGRKCTPHHLETKNNFKPNPKSLYLVWVPIQPIFKFYLLRWNAVIKERNPKAKQFHKKLLQ